MTPTLEFIRHYGTEFFCAILFAVLLVRWMRRTQENVTRVLVKGLLTALAVMLFIWLPPRIYSHMVSWDNRFAIGFEFYLGMAFVVPLLALILGVAISILWTPLLGGWLAGLFTGALDGGNEPPDAKPLYSIAKALAARGKFGEALSEIQTQLEKFPGDYEGQMLRAEIQAKHYHDVAAAEATIQKLCDQPGHSPNNVAAALTALADWHLKLARNREAAHRCLAQISGLFPGSEFATAAAQRLAHLGDAEMFLPPTGRPKYPMPEGIKSYGLRSEPGLIQPRTVSPEEQAAQFVKQLEAHPLDTEAREKLAVLYAEHYHRLDLARLQMEQLVAAPNQPPRQVVRWLNLLADLQVHHGADYAAARATLQQIVDRFPNIAAAEMARNRIGLLRLETKGQDKTSEVKLGVYEQNIGLKMNPPRYRS